MGEVDGTTNRAPAPAIGEGSSGVAPRRYLWTSVFGLRVAEIPEPIETGRALQRRQVVSAITLVVGAIGLALTLRMDADSALFPLAALGVAAIWLTGSLCAGPLHLGQITAHGRTRLPIWSGLLTGGVLALLFIGGAFIAARIPTISQPIGQVTQFADHGSLPLLTLTTLLSGIAEELFFRGSLYAALPVKRRVWGTSIVYAIATWLTGNFMLAFAALILGAVTGLQRRATQGVLAPILTHITWSLTMLHVLPLVL